MSILTRENNNDIISIYECETWTQAIKIPTDFSVKDIFYLSDNSGILAWSHATEYIFVVFSLQGEIISRYSSYINAPGLSYVLISKKENYIALCGYDRKIIILHHCSWVKFQELNYIQAIRNENLIIMRESEEFKEQRPEALERLKLEEIMTKSKKTLKCA